MRVPDTECHDCMIAEMTPLQRMNYRVVNTFYDIWNGTPHLDIASAYFGTAIHAMLGITPKTWYDKHRDNWIKTGDIRELERMLRHI